MTLIDLGVRIRNYFEIIIVSKTKIMGHKLSQSSKLHLHGIILFLYLMQRQIPPYIVVGRQ
jgi:hypothetical protein